MCSVSTSPCVGFEHRGPCLLQLEKQRGTLLVLKERHRAERADGPDAYDFHSEVAEDKVIKQCPILDGKRLPIPCYRVLHVLVIVPALLRARMEKERRLILDADGLIVVLSE